MRTKSREIQLAWFAGFVDGEGCLTIVCQQGYFNYKLIVAQKDVRPLVLIKELFGGGLYASPASNNCYQWVITGAKAVELVQEIVPLLVYKQDQARVFVDSWTPTITGENELRVALAHIKLRDMKQSFVTLEDLNAE